MGTFEVVCEVGQVRKSATEVIAVRVMAVGARRFVDARVLLPPILPGPPPQFTKAGLALRAELVRELVPLLLEAADLAAGTTPPPADDGQEDDG